MDVEKFIRHLCRLVLRHQMPVWNYFVNSFYSVPFPVTKTCRKEVTEKVELFWPNAKKFTLQITFQYHKLL
jgi:hypothetical protein